MKSRFLVGAMVLAGVAATIGGTAVAQRADMIRALMDHARERQQRVATDDPRMRVIGAPGDYRFSVPFASSTREYLLHVPHSYRGTPVPLLIALHGGGGDADLQADDSRYGLVSKSEKAGFILLVPNGYSRMPGSILATWNAGTCCGAAQKQHVDDVAFLREVILRVENQVQVDRSKVFVTGMSNGALMSWRLACEAADVVRGIAPVEGTDNTTSCHPARPVPVIEFHALDDDHVPFGGGRGPKAISGTDFASVEATQTKWVRLDRAEPQSRRVLTVPGAHCDLHPARPGGAPVELCVTQTGGHSWPGAGNQERRNTPSRAINANDLMWMFFSSL